MMVKGGKDGLKMQICLWNYDYPSNIPKVICVSYYISGYGWHSSQIQGTSDSLTGCTSLAFSTEEKS